MRHEAACDISRGTAGGARFREYLSAIHNLLPVVQSASLMNPGEPRSESPKSKCTADLMLSTTRRRKGCAALR